MSTYLLRGLVAILTFGVGLAVSSVTHPFKFRAWGHRHPTFVRFENYDQRRCPKFRTRAPDAAVSVDTQSTDPLKLRYSQTRQNPVSPGQQTVDFLTETDGTKEIVGFTVGYDSWWRKGTVERRIDTSNGASSPGNIGLSVVSVDCRMNDSLVVWVSSVEYKDGSRWVNPRHNEARRSL